MDLGWHCIFRPEMHSQAKVHSRIHSRTSPTQPFIPVLWCKTWHKQLRPREHSSGPTVCPHARAPWIRCKQHLTLRNYPTSHHPCAGMGLRPLGSFPFLPGELLLLSSRIVGTHRARQTKPNKPSTTRSLDTPWPRQDDSVVADRTIV